MYLSDPVYSINRQNYRENYYLNKCDRYSLFCSMELLKDAADGIYRYPLENYGECADFQETYSTPTGAWR